MLKHVVLSCFILACAASAGCRRPAPPSPASGPHATIWVGRDGTVELDGHAADLAAVDTALSDLEKQKGTVMYGRDAADGAPPPNGMEIIQMVIKHRLPIRMSTKRDFSDAVGPQ